MKQSVAGAARASRVPVPRTWHANAHASTANRQGMQAKHCKKAMQHFAHGSRAMAAEPSATPDAMGACASPSAAREARRALGGAWERLRSEESKERAHGDAPFLSAAPR
jgi:hypothetical protein